MRDDNEVNAGRDEHSHSEPLAAWFLGPKGEHGATWAEMFSYIFQDYLHWRRNYFPQDQVVISRVRRRKHEHWFDKLHTNLDASLNQLKANFPFYSPRYIAHMLSEQTLPSVLGYFAGMLYNANNVTDEAAPVTVNLELEVGRLVAAMLGYEPGKSWAHLCSGGTVANIEALWVARSAQFVPFIIRDYCKLRKVDFQVTLPDQQQALIRDLDDRQLIGMHPNESLSMVRKLVTFLVDEIGRSPEPVLAEINTFVQASDYNPKYKGFYAVLRKVDLTPCIFVSAAAHYSIKKAANMLGYGEESVKLVPVTSRFRIDMQALETTLFELPKSHYTAAVVAVLGTTEEGAVDPVHQISALRRQLGQQRNRSFWLHIDAAWGGYIRSLFCGHDIATCPTDTAQAIYARYTSAINASETFTLPIKRHAPAQHIEIRWDDPDVYHAFLGMPDADSITVDPHKMGYIPYAAGIIAFQKALVTDLIVQRAQYISDERGGLKSLDEPSTITAVGPYTLEGSKAGATAVSCWLAHTTIRLEAAEHGKIMKTSLLNTKKLYTYLAMHHRMFAQIDAELFPNAKCQHPFSFLPLNEPDTNILCFIAIPMAWQNEELHQIDMSLALLNQLNQRIYEAFPSARRDGAQPTRQAYFVSRTRFEKEQYSSESIQAVLESLRISSAEYEQHGLFVMRSTVMNPLYYTAEQEGSNYLLGFVKHLHREARLVIEGVRSS